MRSAVKAAPARQRKAVPGNRGYGQAGKAKHDPAKHPRDANGRFITTGGSAKATTTRTKKAVAPKPPKKVGTVKQRKGLADQIRAARKTAKTPEARKALLKQVRDLRAKRAEWKRGQGKTQVEKLPKPPKEPKPKKEAKPKTEKQPKEAKPKAPKKEKTPKPPKESKPKVAKEPKPKVEKPPKEAKPKAEKPPKAAEAEKAPKPSEKPPEATAPPDAPGSHATLDAARAWADAHGVSVLKGSPVTLEHLNMVNRQAAKIPPSVMEATRAAGRPIQVLAGRGITDHPDFAHLKGVTPRGYPAGMTWDDVGGAGGGATIVVANKIEQSGSLNLVLHEHAHTYDYVMAKKSGARPSDSPEWRRAHEQGQWSDAYLANHPEEGYAESFARYFGGKASRSFLTQPVQDYWARTMPR
jgi:Pro-Pro endopeptidase